MAKFTPIAYVNRIVFVNLHSVSQFVTTRQPIADWRLFAVHQGFFFFLSGENLFIKGQHWTYIQARQVTV